MEEYLKILEDYSYALATISSAKEQDIKISKAIDHLIQAYKEQQVKIEMAYKKGKNEATSELTIVKEKLLEENTLENIKLKKELEKKDKIIDEMAKSIAVNDSDLCQYIDETIRCKRYAGENKLTCDTCIKQYFEKKVEDK